MYFDRLVNSGSTPALEKMLAFTQARQRMLAENIANIDNPHYRAKQLDAKQFQEQLRTAMATRKETNALDLELSGSDEVTLGSRGELVVTPSEVPAENILFHDDTNARIERQMAMMAENTMMHQATTELLRGRFDGLMKAIRGRIA